MKPNGGGDDYVSEKLIKRNSLIIIFNLLLDLPLLAGRARTSTKTVHRRPRLPY